MAQRTLLSTLIAALLMISAATAKAALREAPTKFTNAVVNHVAVRIDSFADCVVPADDPWAIAAGVNPADLCALDLKGFENKVEILVRSIVNGVEQAPYFGQADTFAGRLVYFKSTLPSSGPITFQLKILGERRAKARAGKPL